MQNLARTFENEKKTPRERFADLLWAAFPGESESEVAEKAARALGCSKRAACYWLRCEADAGITYFFAVAAIAKLEMRLALRRGREGAV